MAGERPAVSANPIVRALVVPDALRHLGPADWSDLIARARAARLGGRLAYLVARTDLGSAIPGKVAGMLLADRRMTARQEQITQWEVRCVRRALAGIDTKIVLLKGAAYILSGLDVARGRVVTDLDFLVPRASLEAVEEALLDNGWRHIKQDAYDQKYYREYAHELPPLVHGERHTVLDVHHSLVPVTSRLKIDPEPLLADAEPIGETGLWRLAPPDMVAHAAIHLFHDGEVAGHFRDLVDVDGLLREFGPKPGFWSALADRAHRPGLGRPLFYALRYAHRYLGTPIPRTVIDAIERFGPAWPTAAVMDRVIAAALLPGPPFPDRQDNGSGLARQMLYIRSHWLKMPPLLLAAHLLHKSRHRGQQSGR